MGNPIDLSNRRFGKLVALKDVGSRNNKRIWECICDCGRTHAASAAELVRGKTNSCGCSTRSHGHSHDATYNVWASMLQRCENANNKNFIHYGARGISVCERWHKFEYFLADMGARPFQKTIERIDNNEGYSKENCRWATRGEQSKNKRTNKYFTFKGRTRVLRDWERELGFGAGFLTKRLRRMTFEQAMTMPYRSRVSKQPLPAAPEKGEL